MKLLPGAAILVWLAMMAFFGAVVAPAAFGTLDREAAGRFVSAIFPRYYVIGVVLGGLAVAACVARTLAARGRPGTWLPLALVAVMLAATLYAWLVVLPAAHAAREALHQAPPGAAPVEAAAFARLHRLSSILNGVTMLAGVLALVALAFTGGRR
ncbi:MAG TPA: DUF4149 domain-containing protein [Candidatus Bathyarchaeia archaeon]|nr:DUF4149 domain-containing protein [Candidatus Bathyarchaeia archaeon]